MDAMSITMDGVTYRVRIVYNTLVRAFTLIEGVNAGDMISSLRERDLSGTGYTYEMQVEPDPRYPADYDSFFHAISAPVDSHLVVMPYGQTTLIYNAIIESGSDTYKGMIGGVKRYGGLTVRYRYSQPQRTPT